MSGLATAFSRSERMMAADALRIAIENPGKRLGNSNGNRLPPRGLLLRDLGQIVEGTKLLLGGKWCGVRGTTGTADGRVSRLSPSVCRRLGAADFVEHIRCPGIRDD